MNLDAITIQAIENVELLTLLVTLVIAIVGWITALIIQNKGIKQQHKVNIKHDIYQAFALLHKKIQGEISDFASTSRPPFILMDASLIPFQHGLKREEECNVEANRIWGDWHKDMVDKFFLVKNTYIEILYLFEVWFSPLSKLETAQKKLREEFDRIDQSVFSNLDQIPINGYAWQTFDQENIKKLTNEAAGLIQEFGMYLSDYMALIHNELISRYFWKKRKLRKTLTSQYKVLTKKGIVARLDRYFLFKDKYFRKILLRWMDKKDVGEYLDKTCECGISEELIEILLCRRSNNEYEFIFVCGHKVGNVRVSRELGWWNFIVFKIIEKLGGVKYVK